MKRGISKIEVDDSNIFFYFYGINRRFSLSDFAEGPVKIFLNSVVSSIRAVGVIKDIETDTLMGYNEVPSEEKDQHTEQCCKNCGCVFGDDVPITIGDWGPIVTCSVTTGRLKQSSPCFGRCHARDGL